MSQEAPVSVWSMATWMAALALCSDWLLTSFAIPVFPTLGASAVVTGALFGIKSALQLLSAPVVSRLSTGCVPLLSLLLIGLVIDLATTFGFALTRNLATWFVLRGLQGIASSAITSGAFGHLARHYRGHDAELGRAMSFAIAGLLMGVTVGPIVAGVLSEVHPEAPLVFIAVPLVTTISLTLVLRSRLDSDALAAAKEEGNWLTLMRDAAVAGPLVFVFLSNMAVSFLEASVGIHGRRTWGFGTMATGLFWSTAALPTIVGSLLVPHLLKYLDRWRLMLACGFAMAGSLIIGPKTELLAQGASMLGFGFSIGMSAGVAPALLAVASERHGGTAAVYSMQNFAEQLAFLVGPVIGNAAYKMDGLWVASALFAAPLLAAGVAFTYRAIGNFNVNPLSEPLK